MGIQGVRCDSQGIFLPYKFACNNDNLRDKAVYMPKSHVTHIPEAVNNNALNKSYNQKIRAKQSAKKKEATEQNKANEHLIYPFVVTIYYAQ